MLSDSFLNNKKAIKLSIIFTIAVYLYYFLTFIIFGENSVITLFDNLYDMISKYKMFHDGKLFFKFDAPTNAFEEMSTLYYMNINYSFECMLFSFMNTFWAMIVSRYLAILFGFFSMYLLLRKCFSCPVFISILVSCCFSISDTPYNPCIAYNTIPFVAFVFYYFSVKCNKIFSLKSLLLILFAFFSNFTQFGIFICLFWFLGMIFFVVKNKKINYNLLVGFISLCIGYILVDLKLFFIMLILKTPLNRDIRYFNLQSFPFSMDKSLNNFYLYLNHYLNYENLRSGILTKLIFVSAVSIIFICKYFYKHNSVNDNGSLKIIITMLLIHLVLVSVMTLYSMFFITISENLSVFAKFNIIRMIYFARVYLFIIFALCLEIIYSKIFLKAIYLEIQQGIKEKMEINMISFKFIFIFLFAIIQVLYIYYKGDAYKTWSNYIKTALDAYRNETTYKEFYSVKLFTEIKQDISYSNEKVASYGFHPAVLMYNGFNCIDGYNNSYPLSYMKKFKELINPILIENDRAVNDFNFWGGMLYIYNDPKDMNYEPLLDRYNYFRHNLQVNMEVLREKFGVKYILSAYELDNAHDVGLSLNKIFIHKDSIYTIYLYALR